MRRRSPDSVKIRYPRYDRDQLVIILRKRFSYIAKKYKIKRVILFGSYASNKYTASSDIDLLIIHESSDENLYKKIRVDLDIRGIELHIYTQEEYKMHKYIIDKMIKHGITIYQI